MLLERLHQMRCGLIRYVASKWLCLGWEMLVNPLDFIEWFMCTCDFLHLAVPDSLIFIKKKYNYYRSEKALSPSPFPSEKALLHAFNVVVIIFFFLVFQFPNFNFVLLFISGVEIWLLYYPFWNCSPATYLKQHRITVVLIFNRDSNLKIMKTISFRRGNTGISFRWINSLKFDLWVAFF